ncbi:MAG: PIN domain-containing protein, partial [Verrucomicrobia bacterium]|nr:PIN domain-containing protein [Verrucomicrobiota bacterium]
MKNYILDTNVLLHDPNSLQSFQEHAVLIPIEVIEEIDRFKRESSELGQNARTVSRMLDALRESGRLSEGIKLPNGGRLKVVYEGGNKGNTKELPDFASDTVDNRILALALKIQRKAPKTQTVLVTKDINLRIKADALRLHAEDYETDRVFIKDLYTGMIETTLPTEKLA